MDIAWLGEPAGADRTLTGGKAAALSALTAVGNVPPGFCLTTAAFARWSAGAMDEGGALPPPLGEALGEAYRALAGRCGEASLAVAVRSSAVDEDGRAASFAGQHDTYLHVVGAAAVAEAVARCWRSGRSERALAYRRRCGLPPGRPPLAVLVQQLIVADVSAVAFTADPVSGGREAVVINASWGLGESLVGGLVTPDTYVVCKADLAVVSRRVADKRAMTVPAPGGTRQVAVPRFLRRQPALDEGQAAAMARLALTLEAALGWPVDVECACRAGELYLLQCRPVTALPR